MITGTSHRDLNMVSIAGNNKSINGGTRHQLARIALAVGLGCGAFACSATLIPPLPPTLEDKVNHTEVIVEATIGETKYYNWSDPGHLAMPRVSKSPLKTFDPFVGLVNVEILFDKYANDPVDRSLLKSSLPLSTQPQQCFGSENSVIPSKGQRLIFFISGPHRAAQGTLKQTSCQFTAVSIDQRSAVLNFIGRARQKTN